MHVWWSAWMTHHAGNFSPKKLAQYKQLECDVSLQNDACTIYTRRCMCTVSSVTSQLKMTAVKEIANLHVLRNSGTFHIFALEYTYHFKTKFCVYMCTGTRSSIHWRS